MIAFRFPLVLLFFLPLLVLWFSWANQRGKLLPQVGAALREHLLARLDPGRRTWKRRLGLLGLALLALAASGPQIGTRLAPVERVGIDLVIALDVSTSMAAEDVKPSRLKKAQLEVSQMIKSLKGDRIGLIVFAGSSHLYLPLTTDYEAAQLFLDAVDTGMIPTQGTSLSAALRTGLSAFPEGGEKYQVLVLISDGEDHEGQAIALAREAAARGIVLHTVGVGTRSGSLVPLEGSGGKRDYKRDRQGKLVTSVLKAEVLQEIAAAGKGVYARFDNRLANYQEILTAVDRMEKRTLKTHVYAEFEDRYQLFAVLAAILWILRIVYPTRKGVEPVWRGRYV